MGLLTLSSHGMAVRADHQADAAVRLQAAINGAGMAGAGRGATGAALPPPTADS